MPILCTFSLYYIIMRCMCFACVVYMENVGYGIHTKFRMRMIPLRLVRMVTILWLHLVRKVNQIRAVRGKLTVDVSKCVKADIAVSRKKNR